MNPFQSWTAADVAAFNRKATVPLQLEPVPIGEPVEREKPLHNDILQECRQRGWIALHGRMDASSGRTLGEFDFVILADKQRVFFVEAKTRTGKLSPEQLAMHAWAKKLGHEPVVVRSLQDFLNLL